MCVCVPVGSQYFIHDYYNITFIPNFEMNYLNNIIYKKYINELIN